MRAVGLKVLKNRLSEYVRLAAAGETVLIADRDRVVAELRPPEPGRGARLADAALADAVREGWITPPLEGGAQPPPGAPVASLAELLAELRADRELAMLELVRPVLARALERYAVPVRTFDALHLASAEFLRARGERVRVASYDQRFLLAARSVGLEAYPLV